MVKKIFNEKKYQKTKKILNIIGMSWIVGVIIISIVITSFGAYGANKSKEALNEAINNTTETTIVSPEVATETGIDMSEQPYDLSDYTGPKTEAELDAAVAAIEAQHTIAMGQDGWYDDQVAEMKAVSKITSAFHEYEAKNESNISWLRRETTAQEEAAQEAAQNIADKAFDNVASMSKGMMSGFYGISDIAIGSMSLVALIGVAITTIVCCLPGVILLFVANSRAIYAFTAQSTVPVAKESTEQMSPAFGTAAREITKGIKAGWTSSNSKKKIVKKKAKK